MPSTIATKTLAQRSSATMLTFFYGLVRTTRSYSFSSPKRRSSPFSSLLLSMSRWSRKIVTTTNNNNNQHDVPTTVTSTTNAFPILTIDDEQPPHPRVTSKKTASTDNNNNNQSLDDNSFFDRLTSSSNNKVPYGFWKSVGNRRRFFDHCAAKLGLVRFPDDWYSISREAICKLGGAGLLEGYYKGSLIGALIHVYPEHEWIPWRFSASAVPVGFWRDKINQRRFFDWAGKQLGVEKIPDDWYDTNKVAGLEAIYRLGGASLVDVYYRKSLSAALAAVYPEHEWLPWKFRSTPQGYWRDKQNQRRFFDWAARQLNISTAGPDDWYKVSKEDISKLGGAGLLNNYHDGSLTKALASVYPEFDWQPWRFQNFKSVSVVTTTTTTTTSINKSEQQQQQQEEENSNNNNNSSSSSNSTLRRYVEFLARELGIERLDDWYRVSLDQIRKSGGYPILVQHGGLLAVLKRLYPEHHWKEEAMRSTAKKANQRWLKLAAQRLFPGQQIFEEFQHQSMSYKGSGSKITLDVWIPSLSLALEYNGAQHYHDFYMFDNPSHQKVRDDEKLQACKNAGITLIVVSYRWNGSVKDLAAAIADARPDLLPLMSSSSTTNI